MKKEETMQLVNSYHVFLNIKKLRTILIKKFLFYASSVKRVFNHFNCMTKKSSETNKLIVAYIFAAFGVKSADSQLHQ